MTEEKILAKRKESTNVAANDLRKLSSEIRPFVRFESRTCSSTAMLIWSLESLTFIFSFPFSLSRITMAYSDVVHIWSKQRPVYSTSSFSKKISGRLWRRIKNRRRQIRWYDLNNNESTTLLTFIIWNITMFKNEPFLSNRRFKKGCFLKKVRFYFFIRLFLHTFCQKQTFCYPTTFFKSLINHKRFVFFRKVTLHIVNVKWVVL